MDSTCPWPVHKLLATVSYQPLPKRQIWDASKLKEFADDNFNLNENSKKFSQWAENSGKGWNCSLRAISPFPTVFSKDLCCRHVKTGLVWERVKQPFTTQSPLLTTLTKIPFRKHYGNRRRNFSFPHDFFYSSQNKFHFFNFVWCPWSWGRASASQSWGP